MNHIKEFFLNLLFPKACLGCGKEGSYLCPDCQSLIEVSQYQYCPFCYPAKIVLDGKTCPAHQKSKNLNGLYSAGSYQNFLIKKLISNFKYHPHYLKELAEPLACLIIAHFKILDKIPSFLKAEKDYFLIPVPLRKKKFKKRGFNQAAELAKELSRFLEIPLIKNVLIKTKEILPQVELSEEERRNNILGVFSIQNKEKIVGRKILLVDDVFTTGSTMEECAKILKEGGAEEVWGVVTARG